MSSPCPCQVASLPPCWAPTCHQTTEWVCKVISPSLNTDWKPTLAFCAFGLHARSGRWLPWKTRLGSFVREPGTAISHERADALSLATATDLFLDSSSKPPTCLKKAKSQPHNHQESSLEFIGLNAKGTQFFFPCKVCYRVFIRGVREFSRTWQAAKKRKKNMDFGVRLTHLCSESGPAMCWQCVR